MTQELKHPLEGWLDARGRRQRNRRVVTAEHIRRIKRWVAAIADGWENVSGRIYLSQAERAAIAARTGEEWPPITRARGQHEYPENKPEAWDELARYMRDIYAEAVMIEDWATEQARLTRARLAETADKA